jgi:hypothetical protein
MNKYERSRQFADKSTKAARETIERGVWSAEEATNGMRELNVKLIDMAHANVDAAFDLAHEVASAKAPSDLATIWFAHARRQFEMMTKQTRELTELGQRFARNGGPGHRL